MAPPVGAARPSSRTGDDLTGGIGTRAPGLEDAAVAAFPAGHAGTSARTCHSRGEPGDVHSPSANAPGSPPTAYEVRAFETARARPHAMCDIPRSLDTTHPEGRRHASSPARDAVDRRRAHPVRGPCGRRGRPTSRHARLLSL